MPDAEAGIWEPSGADRIMLAEGARVELSYRDGSMQVALIGPVCPECSQAMDWNDELKTWLCGHMEDEDASGDY